MEKVSGINSLAEETKGVFCFFIHIVSTHYLMNLRLAVIIESNTEGVLARQLVAQDLG